MSRKFDCIKSKNGFMESVEVIEDRKKVLKKKKMWFWWVSKNEVCNCFEEWGEVGLREDVLKEMSGVCVCGGVKKVCMSEECDCGIIKLSECIGLEVLDEYYVVSGKVWEDRKELKGLREVRV